MTDATPQGYDRTSYVLIVDDDQTLLKFFKIHLNKFFSRVIVVKNAKEALDEIDKGGIDLVLTDIRMPRMDGLQLLRKVKAQDATIPVLLISGAVLNEKQALEAEANIDGFLRKPFSVDGLNASIKAGMERREYLKKLGALVGDQKLLAPILKGTRRLDRVVSSDKLAEAESLLAALTQTPAQNDQQQLPT